MGSMEPMIYVLYGLAPGTNNFWEFGTEICCASAKKIVHGEVFLLARITNMVTLGNVPVLFKKKKIM